jgi:hypothetical protein
MKNLKIKLSALMILVGTGAALATVRHTRTTDHKWSRNPSSSVYTDITGQEVGSDYRCLDAAQICTATYPEGVNPNDQSSDAYPGTALPSSTESGLFE